MSSAAVTIKKIRWTVYEPVLLSDEWFLVLAQIKSTHGVAGLETEFYFGFNTI